MKEQILSRVLLLFVCLAFAAERSQASNIDLATIPERISAFEAEARVVQSPPTLVFHTHGGNSSKLHVQINTPAETPWLSSDFPVIEGKMLFDAQMPLPEAGVWSLKAMLPIRGNYLIPVTVYKQSGAKSSEEFTVIVNENPAKYFYFAGIALILLLVGFTGGLMIGGRQEMDSEQPMPKRVELLLRATAVVAIFSMFALAVNAEMNLHQQCNHEGTSTQNSALTARNRHCILRISGDKDTEVGVLSSFKVEAIDAQTNHPLEGLPLQVRVAQMEDNFPILSFSTKTDKAGQISWRQSFFDGAPHRVEAKMSTDNGESLSVWRIVSVEPIHPTLSRRLTTFAYMIMFLILGLIGGLLVKERRIASKAS